MFNKGTYQDFSWQACCYQPVLVHMRPEQIVVLELPLPMLKPLPFEPIGIQEAALVVKEAADRTMAITIAFMGYSLD